MHPHRNTYHPHSYKLLSPFSLCNFSLNKSHFKEELLRLSFLAKQQENGGNENEGLCCLDGGLDGPFNHAKGNSCRSTSTKPNI
ncbi:hypothetical protein NC651_009706 [Populus alba x Populus x berolinensis]|nr:hypothetical protein NC651_009706 [Populus alba x Populus x berolinensis]